MSKNSSGKIVTDQTGNIVGAPTGNNVMQGTIDWSNEIALIAGPIKTHDSRESWLLRAARKAGITEWHSKALFYGQLKDPKYSVAYRVLSAADRARLEGAKCDAKQIADIYLSTAATLAGTASSLAHTDSDFHSTSIAALVEAARVISGSNTS